MVADVAGSRPHSGFMLLQYYNMMMMMMMGECMRKTAVVRIGLD